MDYELIDCKDKTKWEHAFRKLPAKWQGVFFTSKVPKLEIFTEFIFFRLALIRFIKYSNKSFESCFEMSVSLAICFAISRLVNVIQI